MALIMDENKTAIEASAPTIAPEGTVKVSTVTEVDLEAKNLALEVEKTRLIEEKENYKNAYLKEKRKKEQFIVEEDDLEETQEEKMRRIAQETLSNSRIAEITREQDSLLQKALKENKELKLAQLNKTNIPPAGVGTSNESTPVTSTSITPEQMTYFKSRGWDDKTIEKYKKNLQKGLVR